MYQNLHLRPASPLTALQSDPLSGAYFLKKSYFHFVIMVDWVKFDEKTYLENILLSGYRHANRIIYTYTTHRLLCC